MAHSNPATQAEPGAQPEVSGLLNIAKPLGLSSHDVVARTRRILNLRRVGHAGTLDPLAEGVLVLCIGPATRISEYLMDGAKVYRATILLGQETDTWDGEGVVTAERDATWLTSESIVAALSAFTGEIEQVPPMFSALKQNGRPLYRLARRGVEVPRAARTIEIASATLESWDAASSLAVILFTCSRGTYIRALAHDLGQALGVGGTLAGLTRLAVGPFRLEQAVTLRALSQEPPDGWRHHLLPAAAGLGHMPAVILDEEALRRIRFGLSTVLSLAPTAPDQLAAGYDAQSELVVILVGDPITGLWQPRKVLTGAL